MRIAGPGNPGNPQRAQPAQARRGRAPARMPACVTPEPSHPTSVLACTGPAGDPRTGVAKRGQAADMSELPLRILMQRPAPAFVISHAVRHMTERWYPSSGWARTPITADLSAHKACRGSAPNFRFGAVLPAHGAHSGKPPVRSPLVPCTTRQVLCSLAAGGALAGRPGDAGGYVRRDA